MSFFGCQFVSFKLGLVCAVYSSCDTLFGSSENSCAVIRLTTTTTTLPSLVGGLAGEARSLPGVCRCSATSPMMGDTPSGVVCPEDSVRGVSPPSGE